MHVYSQVIDVVNAFQVTNQLKLEGGSNITPVVVVCIAIEEGRESIPVEP